MSGIQNNVVDTKTIEWAELKTYEFNSLKSSDNRDITKLKNAIVNSGFNFPFYVWHGHRYVIDGKGRDIALHELEKEGYKIPPLPIIEIKADNKAMAKRLVLQASSNHGQVTPESFADFTLDLELEPLDFEMFELGLGDLKIDDIDASEFTEGLTDEDAVPEEPVEPRTKLGDVWLCGNHRVMCGDSTSVDAVDKLMNGKKADMVFTDPPYNIDYQGVKDKREKIKNDKMSDDDFVDFLTQSIISCETMYVCCSWQYAHLFRKALEIIGRKPKAMIVWDKVNPAQHLDKYFKQHEIIFYYGDFGGHKTLRGDVWTLKRQRNTVHPTMKPVELIEIALNDNPTKKIIQDSFGGSGSTLIACEKTSRTCYTMELDEKYCDVIVNRWQEFTGKQATLESTGELFNEKNDN